MAPRELITEHYLAAARWGDFATAYGYFADDLRIRIPGRSQWAGERTGKQQTPTPCATTASSRSPSFEGDQYAVDEQLH